MSKQIIVVHVRRCAGYIDPALAYLNSTFVVEATPGDIPAIYDAFGAEFPHSTVSLEA